MQLCIDVQLLIDSLGKEEDEDKQQRPKRVVQHCDELVHAEHEHGKYGPQGGHPVACSPVGLLSHSAKLKLVTAADLHSFDHGKPFYTLERRLQGAPDAPAL